MAKISVDFGPKGLEELLNAFGIDTSLWGKGESHYVDHFWQELKSGESLLHVGNGLERRLEVVKMLIKDPYRGTLLEDYQILPDGRRKDRQQTPGGKIGIHESTHLALVREMYEELGLVENDYAFQQLDEYTEEKPSKSYPGLRCVYVMYPFAITLKPHVRIEDGHMTVDKEDGKKLFFRWKKD